MILVLQATIQLLPGAYDRRIEDDGMPQLIHMYRACIRASSQLTIEERAYEKPASTKVRLNY